MTECRNCGFVADAHPVHNGDDGIWFAGVNGDYAVGAVACSEFIQGDETRHACECDRQYRLGYEQAWREWSACIQSASPMSAGKGWISPGDLLSMERRLKRIRAR